MVAKLVVGVVITVVAMLVLLLVLTALVGIIAGLLAPFLGSVPVSYNFRSIRERWTSTIVAVLGIAGTVGVFIAMLSLARGFRATLVSSGSEDNALITRAGATSEMTSGVALDAMKIIQDAPGIAAFHRHRCQRSTSWSFTERPGHSPQRQNNRGADVPAWSV